MVQQLQVVTTDERSLGTSNVSVWGEQNGPRTPQILTLIQSCLVVIMEKYLFIGETSF
jgi:hypothetical protein